MDWNDVRWKDRSKIIENYRKELAGLKVYLDVIIIVVTFLVVAVVVIIIFVLWLLLMLLFWLLYSSYIRLVFISYSSRIRHLSLLIANIYAVFDIVEHSLASLCSIYIELHEVKLCITLRCYAVGKRFVALFIGSSTKCLAIADTEVEKMYIEIKLFSLQIILTAAYDSMTFSQTQCSI